MNDKTNPSTHLRKSEGKEEGGSISNNSIRSNNSNSYQKVSVHDGMNPNSSKNETLNEENNSNLYQEIDINYESNEFLDNSKNFYENQVTEEEDENNIYKNKYRSSKYQYKLKHPVSSTFSSFITSQKASSLYKSNSLDDISDIKSKKESISLKRISNSVQNMNLGIMKNKISQKIPISKINMMNYTIKSKFNKDIIYNILKRLQVIISEVQRNELYQNSISVLIKLVNDFIKNGIYTMKNAEKSVDSSIEDYNITESLRALKTIMENLAQGYSLNKLLIALGNIREYVKNDKFKKEYIKKINKYLYRVLKDPQYIQSQEYIDVGMMLLDEGILNFSEKYSHQKYFHNELETVLNESSKYMDHLISDPLTRRFSHSLMQLTKDIFMNRNGKVTFKKDLFKDIITMSLPIVVQNIRYIPISRLEYEDSNYHLVMEDIFLSSDNFLPNVMEAKIKHSSIIGLRKSINNDFRNYITLNLYEIQADIRDVPFWYHKKKGFPKMTDWGVANFTVGGKGITIMTKFEICKNDPYRIIVPRKIECFVDDLHLEVNRSKFGILYSLGSPMINSKIRRQLITNIRKNIFDAVDNVNECLVRMRDSYTDDINFSWIKTLAL
ncbi:hypothetical protein BCR36DRAFT_467338 [Piromyces finnis]|uniref:HAM1-like N-terminal domain-containing protein n=1 Tax=Piromyces finnis TaxID=1754191 RepID=A0A1Y1VIE7_9FUNG|nr:hypothetical protein BCR36DRAFT_467338 [Piromyces finnis]|eukprot:ORX56103.1 hypothetical protein BCR36DRAFT_467338 [Piromyces finnis]